MGTGRRLVAWAPAWMWLFWLIGALVIAAGLRRGGEPQPRFLVATGQALEIWRGPERESTLLRFEDGATVVDAAMSPDGRRIAVIRLSPPPTRADADFGTDLYLVNADGSNPRLVVRRSS